MEINAKKIGKDWSLFVAHKMLEEIVYNMAQLEGNSLSFAETASVVQGVSVGGKPMFELNQVDNIKKGWRAIIQEVKNNTFCVTKQMFIEVNKLVAKDENPQLGRFRTKKVTVAGSPYTPPLAIVLDERFKDLLKDYNRPNQHPLKKGFDVFLSGSRNQFFCDGNKRTSLLMANGILMMNGYGLLSIDQKKKEEYVDKIIRFYETGKREEMYTFLGKSQAQIGLPSNLSEPNPPGQAPAPKHLRQRK